jgi:hypothetical protein
MSSGTRTFSAGYVLALSLGGCTHDGPACDENGSCAAGTTDTGTSSSTTTTVGNDVSLDKYPPVVVRTVPVTGSLAVDPVTTTTMEVEFDRPMGPGYAWWSIDENAPDNAGVAWVDSFTNALTGVVLADDLPYQLWINDPFGEGDYDKFTDEDGQAALEYPVVFATGSDPGLIAGMATSVTASTPAAGAEDVDPALDRLEVTFGKDMDPMEGGWLLDQAKTYPQIDETAFSDPRTMYADVVLEPSTTYAIWLDGFVDTDGNAAARWLLTFRTADAD